MPNKPNNETGIGAKQSQCAPENIAKILTAIASNLKFSTRNSRANGPDNKTDKKIILTNKAKEAIFSLSKN